MGSRPERPRRRRRQRAEEIRKQHFDRIGTESLSKVVALVAVEATELFVDVLGLDACHLCKARVDHSLHEPIQSNTTDGQGNGEAHGGGHEFDQHHAVTIGLRPGS